MVRPCSSYSLRVTQYFSIKSGCLESVTPPCQAYAIGLKINEKRLQKLSSESHLSNSSRLEKYLQNRSCEKTNDVEQNEILYKMPTMSSQFKSIHRRGATVA